MSSSNNIDVLTEIAIVAGSVAASTGLYYVAVKNWSKLADLSFAISKISEAKTVPLSGLRSVLSSESKSGSASSKEMFVVVRGVIEANSRSDSNNDALVSQLSQEKCVLLEQTWGSMPYRERITLSTNSPFILSESYQKDTAHALVYLDGSNHQLPLKMIEKSFSAMATSSSEFLMKEMFLPVGKPVTVVGVCSLQDGNPQIKACNELPFFITTLSSDGMIRRLTDTRRAFFWVSFPAALLSVTVLLTNIPTFISLWKRWRRARGKGKHGKRL